MVAETAHCSSALCTSRRMCWAHRAAMRYCSGCGQANSNSHGMMTLQNSDCPSFPYHFHIEDYCPTDSQMFDCLVRQRRSLLILSRHVILPRCLPSHSAGYSRWAHIADCRMNDRCNWGMKKHHTRQMRAARSKSTSFRRYNQWVGSPGFLLGRRNCCGVHMEVP